MCLLAEMIVFERMAMSSERSPDAGTRWKFADVEEYFSDTQHVSLSVVWLFDTINQRFVVHVPVN